MARAQDPWSNIPLDLADLVLKRLPAHVDRIRFAAVCPQWRSAAAALKGKLPPPMPLLALKAGDVFHSMPRGEPLHFAGCKNGFDTACGNWLVYRELHSLLLVDPFSGATITLPAPSSIHPPDKDECEDSRDGDSVYTNKSLLQMDVTYSQVIKLMVCSSNLIAALFIGRNFYWIAVCRPGGSMWSVAWDLTLRNTDMAFYQGKLYVVDYREDLLALGISVDDNTGDPRVARIARVINVNHDEGTMFSLKRFRKLHLVESCGSLLLVRRMIFRVHARGGGQIHTFAGQCEPDVSILKADFGQSQWVKVTFLADDQALFLGPCSRAVCMPQGDSPGNRVWFLDDYKNFYNCHDDDDDDDDDDANNNLSSGTSSVANPKPLSPLPMISWRGYQEFAGAAWLFPAN